MVVVVWFNIVHCPVFVVVSQVRSWEIVWANLDDLDGQADQSLDDHCSVKPFPALVEVVHLDDRWNAEPDVVGQVPWLVNTVVFLTPWPNVVHHEHVKKEVLFARMALLVLVKHRSIPASCAHEEPQEKKHENIQRRQPPVPLQKYSYWIGPEVTIILLMLFQHRKWESEPCDEKEAAALKVGLQDEVEEVGVNPFVDNF